MPPFPDQRFGDADPLDTRLAASHGQSAAAGPWWALRSRLALGMALTPRPGLVLLTLGGAIGPAGLNVLSPSVLTNLDPIVSVALAALGVMVGFGLHTHRPGDGRLLAAASLQAAVTVVMVAAGVWALELLWLRTGAGHWWLAALVGLSAAATSTAAQPSDDDTVAMRISDLDDVLPIVLGGLVLTMLSSGPGWAPLLLTLAAGTMAALVAMAGWLLIGRTATESEQRTFLAGALLLIGGVAAYLSQSALFTGLAAGITWNLAGGEARDRIARDLRALQHPLIVLLLIVAGARVTLAVAALTLAVAYLACRVSGKLLGGWLVGRWVGRGAASGLGVALVSPGVAGIAFAMNVVQADADVARAGMVLAIVVVGSLASELVSLALGRTEAP